MLSFDESALRIDKRLSFTILSWTWPAIILVIIIFCDALAEHTGIDLARAFSWSFSNPFKAALILTAVCGAMDKLFPNAAVAIEHRLGKILEFVWWFVANEFRKTLSISGKTAAEMSTIVAMCTFVVSLGSELWRSFYIMPGTMPDPNLILSLAFPTALLAGGAFLGFEMLHEVARRSELRLEHLELAGLAACAFAGSFIFCYNFITHADGLSLTVPSLWGIFWALGVFAAWSATKIFENRKPWLLSWLIFITFCIPWYGPTLLYKLLPLIAVSPLLGIAKLLQMPKKHSVTRVISAIMPIVFAIAAIMA